MIRFPAAPDSAHPQYLWNNQEYIVRMLNQNALKIGIDEIEDQVTIYTTPENSLNVVANGAADFPVYSLHGVFDTNLTRWVYLRADGAEFYISDQQPEYNQYMHGWYHNENRAVVFIDGDKPNRFRAVLMDTYNAHYEYNLRIADTGGDLVFEKYTGGLVPIFLPSGKYRFEIRGGRGGRGGDGWSGHQGGAGAIADLFIFKLTLYKDITLAGYVGFDGTNGQGFQERRVTVTSGRNITSSMQGTSGGGGSSGEDSYLLYERRLLAESIGGAGGGGTMIVAGLYISSQISYFAGAGGGGSGSGVAGNGSYQYQSGSNPGGLSAAQRGTLELGGGGSPGSWVNTLDWGIAGGAGENRGTSRRRNGGNSPQIRERRVNNSWGNNYIGPSYGGSGVYNTSSGHILVYRLGSVA